MKQLPCVDFNADGAFESMRSYKGKIFELDAHMNRLEDSLKSLGLADGFDKNAVAKLVEKRLEESGISVAYIRVAVSSGSNKIQVIIKKAASYPEAYYKRGVSLKTSSVKKNTQASLSPQAKSSNFLSGVLAKIDNPDSFEQVLLDKNGFVAEGTTSNIFIVKGEAVMTPPLYIGVLAGVTRAAVMRLAMGLGLAVKETPFTRHELYISDEVFITNTSMGVMPVTCVDGRVIGEGKVGGITKKLTRAFYSIIEG